MSKIYKVKDKLAIYLPFDVIASLGIKEGDDIDFFKYSDKYYMVAKKDDILKLMMQQQTAQKPVQTQQQPKQMGPFIAINAEELIVLKKLDSIKYSDRTKEKLKQALSANEKKVLVGLVKRKLVSPFKKAGDQVSKFGIAKSVYNQYLFGQREPSKDRQPQKPVTIQIPQMVAPQMREQEPKRWEQKLNESHIYLDMLEQNGFLVVANQAEAGAISTELEQSIRTGQVVGTRAFNKKYYITLKSFVSKNAQKLFKAMGTKSTSVSDISKATGIEEEGIRGILYILAEQGEVTETRRDIFRVV
jgi:bifunctional DNA-binding transcriptional regulator/antitoxin component of YhaV-PrlF toxin-antitoxin module